MLLSHKDVYSLPSPYCSVKVCSLGGFNFKLFFEFWNCRNCKRLHEFEEIKISRQSCRGDCELQKKKLIRLLSGFLQRIRLLYKLREFLSLNHSNSKPLLHSASALQMSRVIYISYTMIGCPGHILFWKVMRNKQNAANYHEFIMKILDDE